MNIQYAVELNDYFLELVVRFQDFKFDGRLFCL